MFTNVTSICSVLGLEVLAAIESQPSTESSAPTSTDVNGEDDNFDFDTDSPLPMIPDCTSKKKVKISLGYYTMFSYVVHFLSL